MCELGGLCVSPPCLLLVVVCLKLLMCFEITLWSRGCLFETFVIDGLLNFGCSVNTVFLKRSSIWMRWFDHGHLYSSTRLWKKSIEVSRRCEIELQNMNNLNVIVDRHTSFLIFAFLCYLLVLILPMSDALAMLSSGLLICIQIWGKVCGDIGKAATSFSSHSQTNLVPMLVQCFGVTLSY